MILTGERCSTWIKTCPIVTFSITDPTWTVLGSNPGLHGKSLATYRLSHGMACHHEVRQSISQSDSDLSLYINSILHYLMVVKSYVTSVLLSPWIYISMHTNVNASNVTFIQRSIKPDNLHSLQGMDIMVQWTYFHKLEIMNLHLTNKIVCCCVITGNIPGSILHQIPVRLIPHSACEDTLRQTHLGRYFILNPSFQCAVPTSPSQDLCKVGHISLTVAKLWNLYTCLNIDKVVKSRLW
jgi:hypothetical protein